MADTMTGTMTATWAEAAGIRSTETEAVTGLCRKLVAAGHTSRLELHDALTGKPRVIVRNIAKAALMTVSDTDRRGPVWVR